MVKIVCPHCGNKMPYVANNGYTCLVCGFIIPEKKNKQHNEDQHE